MAQLENLTVDDVSNLNRFFNEKIKPVNPEASLNIRSMFDMSEKRETITEERLCKLEEKVDAINNKLNHIFGDHFLLNGQFVDIKK